jgi:hypothetical protein
MNLLIGKLTSSDPRGAQFHFWRYSSQSEMILFFRSQILENRKNLLRCRFHMTSTELKKIDGLSSGKDLELRPRRIFSSDATERGKQNMVDCKSQTRNRPIREYGSQSRLSLLSHVSQMLRPNNYSVQDQSGAESGIQLLTLLPFLMISGVGSEEISGHDERVIFFSRRGSCSQC